MSTIQPTVTVEAKPHWASKLNWLGLIQLLIGIGELVRAFLETNAAQNATTLIGPVEAPMEVGGLAWIVSGILTMVFRKLTKRPTGKKNELVDLPVKAEAKKLEG